jgi:nucleoside 2-deoxyribosyltransferase
MQYNDEMIDIYKKFFKPAVEETGFDLRILRDVLHAGLIDNQLRVEIRKSRFLLADLSHSNNGSYWEAGFAEGLGRPVIYLCEKIIFNNVDSKPHFDTNHHTTIIWDKQNIPSCLDELKSTIRLTFLYE